MREIKLEWLSIKDRLPDDEQECIGLFIDGSVRNISYINSHEGFDPYAEPMHLEVTHWIPLPKSPFK